MLKKLTMSSFDKLYAAAMTIIYSKNLAPNKNPIRERDARPLNKYHKEKINNNLFTLKLPS